MRLEAPSILLVDDDLDFCTSMADILADLGYHVDVAHEGATALTLARRRAYDVAILDLRMPDMDGVTLCKQIQRLRLGMVPILLTAFADAPMALQAMDAGVAHVLTKPANIPKLLSLIVEAIKQPLVLIVDDDLCASLRDLLQGRGFRVCIAHDETRAIERVRESTRVVLLDLQLPGGGGRAVFRKVRQVNPVTPVILITGHRKEMEAMVGQLVADGVDAVHYKPFDIPQLLDDLGRLADVSGAGARISPAREFAKC